MKPARPASIRLFAVLFFAQALSAYLAGMLDLGRFGADLHASLPGVPLDHDSVIVILSARLSIALIPIALIWFFRANFARWLVTLMAIGGILGLPSAITAMNEGWGLWPLAIASIVLKPLAAALLFTRSARSWFARKDGDAAPLP